MLANALTLSADANFLGTNALTLSGNAALGAGKRAVNAAARWAQDAQVNVNIAVVDAGGNLAAVTALRVRSVS